MQANRCRASARALQRTTLSSIFPGAAALSSAACASAGEGGGGFLPNGTLTWAGGMSSGRMSPGKVELSRNSWAVSGRGIGFAVRGAEAAAVGAEAGAEAGAAA